MSSETTPLRNKFISIGNITGKILSIDDSDDVVYIKTLDGIKFIPKEKLKKAKIFSIDFKGNADKILLFLEALRLNNAYLYDKIYAVNVSNIDVLPHQLEAVYDYILPSFKKRGKLRFLLADDVGAGKTIMAGMVIKELKHRVGIKRILIVVPKILEEKWKNEIESRFFENVRILDSKSWDWFVHEKDSIEGIIVTSIDFAKQDGKREVIASVNWDLVIFDEAHKLSARIWGKDIKRTLRYRLGEELCKRVKNVLFLTATPHTGHPDRFMFLLELLDPETFHIYLPRDKVKSILLNKELPMYLRRLKTEFVSLGGKKLIPERIVNTIPFTLSEMELEVYKELTMYIRFLYNISKQSKRRNYQFVMLIFQKRFASSFYAIEKSLEKRLRKLQEIKQRIGIVKEKEVEIGDYSELTEKEDEILESIIDPAFVDEEINHIEKLLEKIRKLKGLDTKLDKLKDTIEEIRSEEGKNFKLIIFSEYKDTVEYLKNQLRSYKVVVIHGDQPYEERIKNLEFFKRFGEILIATDAAGEGIDLQFCHFMINYDIPWSPIVLEQRMGRIHRYGQETNPWIFNFVAENTREGQVLKRLLEKLEQIKEDIGEKIYDIIGEIIENEEEFIELVSNAVIEVKESEKKIEESLSKKNVYEKLEELIVQKPGDYRNYLKYIEMSEKTRIVPEYFEKILIQIIKEIYGIDLSKMRRERRIKTKFFGEKKVSYYPLIEEIKEDILKSAKLDSLRKKEFFTVYPQIFEEFRRDKLELITPEHPIFKILVKKLKEKIKEDLYRGGIVIIDKDITGYTVFYNVEFRCGNRIIKKMLIPILVHNGSSKVLPSSIVGEFYTAEIEMETPSLDQPPNVKNILNEEIERTKQDIEKWIERVIEERYRLREISLGSVIERLESEIASLREDLQFTVDEREYNKKLEQLRRKEDELEIVKRRYEKLREEIEAEKNIDCSKEQITILKVIPSNVVFPDKMFFDPEVENIAMQVVMDHERKNGRIPVDVSQEYVGYDIESRDGEGNVLRYIEVKGRAKVGEIVMTQKEWSVAEKLDGRYYLYVVWNTKTKPELIIIKNPAEKLSAKIEKRYHIDESEIKKKGELVKE